MTTARTHRCHCFPSLCVVFVCVGRLVASVGVCHSSRLGCPLRCASLPLRPVSWLLAAKLHATPARRDAGRDTRREGDTQVEQRGEWVVGTVVRSSFSGPPPRRPKRRTGLAPHTCPCAWLTALDAFTHIHPFSAACCARTSLSFSSASLLLASLRALVVRGGFGWIAIQQQQLQQPAAASRRTLAP
jgi:hypothetical protein